MYRIEQKIFPSTSSTAHNRTSAQTMPLNESVWCLVQASRLEVWLTRRLRFVPRRTKQTSSESLVASAVLEQCVAKPLTLLLPRVINVKFLLQPHQKYYITQYGEPGFSQLTHMKDDYTTNSHYLTYTFLF